MGDDFMKDCIPTEFMTSPKHLERNIALVGQVVHKIAYLRRMEILNALKNYWTQMTTLYLEESSKVIWGKKHVNVKIFF